MVGVPGRSKGCNTCRKRKIGCDQKRPECGNCIKSNRVCAGYHRAVVFRNATGPGLNPNATKALVSSDPRAGSSDDDGSSTSASAKDVMPVSPRRLVREVGFTICVSPPPQPHYRTALLACFLDGCVPPDGPSSGVPSVWVRAIPRAINCGVQVLDTSAMAVSTVFFGRQSRDERIVQESTKIYTRALAQLNAALSNKTMHTRDETLAATMLLGMYETMGCADPLTWQRHADGMELLVRVRGPEAHTTELGHHLFTSFRGTSLTNSLVSCKRNFLASKEWLTIPWTKTQKTPMQQLQDLHLELPGVLEARRALPRSAHPSLLRRCLDFKARLEAWYENFITTPSAHHWLEFSALDIDPSVFPTCYRFPNIGVANTYTFYWANLIVLNYTIIGLTPACQSPLVTTDEIYDLAAQICMSVEYFVAPERKSYGPVLTMYPLRVATGCFMRMGARGKKSTLWCKAIFGVLGERGVMLAKMLEMVVWENKETEEAESVGTVHEWAKKEFWGRVEEGLDEPETEM